MNGLDPFTKSVILDKVGGITNGMSPAEIKEFLDYIDIFGNPASNIKLEIIIENKYENIVYELGEMYL